MFSSADPYMKPVESTLVRHVQSSQDDSQQLEKGNVELFPYQAMFLSLF